MLKLAEGANIVGLKFVPRSRCNPIGGVVVKKIQTGSSKFVRVTFPNDQQFSKTLLKRYLRQTAQSRKTFRAGWTALSG